MFTVTAILAEAATRPLAKAGLIRYLRGLRELGSLFSRHGFWFGGQIEFVLDLRKSVQ